MKRKGMILLLVMAMLATILPMGMLAAVGEETETEPEVMSFEATVRIRLMNTGELYYGDTVKLMAVVEANEDFSIAWERLDADADEELWLSVGSGVNYAFVVNETNALWTYRAVVNGQVVSAGYNLPTVLARPEPEETEEPAEEQEATEDPAEKPEVTEEPAEEPEATEEPAEELEETEEPAEEPEATEDPAEEPEATEEPAEDPAKEPEATEDPAEEPEATEEPAEEPEAIEEPVEEPEATEDPVEEAEATEEPAEEPEVTEEPVEEPEATEEPAEEPEEIEEPVEEPEETEEPAEEAEEIEEPVEEPEATEEPAEEPEEIEEPVEEPEATEEPAEESEAVLNPDRSIQIRVIHNGDELSFGDEVTLVAELSGYENTVYVLQWQMSVDNAEWTDVPDATGASYTMTVTEENYYAFWRVIVTVMEILPVE